MNWITPTVSDMTPDDVRHAVQRLSNAEQYDKHGAKYRARAAARYRSRPANERLFAHARHEMARRGEICDLTLADIVVEEACPCCGILFGAPAPVGTVGTTRRSTGKKVCPPRLPNVPSLDRIDSSRGYLRGNVAVICWDCNRRKRDSNLEQLMNLVAYMQGFQLQ